MIPSRVVGPDVSSRAVSRHSGVSKPASDAQRCKRVVKAPFAPAARGAAAAPPATGGGATRTTRKSLDGGTQRASSPALPALLLAEGDATAAGGELEGSAAATSAAAAAAAAAGRASSDALSDGELTLLLGGGADAGRPGTTTINIGSIPITVPLTYVGVPRPHGEPAAPAGGPHESLQQQQQREAGADAEPAAAPQPSKLSAASAEFYPSAYLAAAAATALAAHSLADDAAERGPADPEPQQQEQEQQEPERAGQQPAALCCNSGHGQQEGPQGPQLKKQEQQEEGASQYAHHHSGAYEAGQQEQQQHYEAHAEHQQHAAYWHHEQQLQQQQTHQGWGEQQQHPEQQLQQQPWSPQLQQQQQQQQQWQPVPVPVYYPVAVPMPPPWVAPPGAVLQAYPLAYAPGPLPQQPQGQGQAQGHYDQQQLLQQQQQHYGPQMPPHFLVPAPLALPPPGAAGTECGGSVLSTPTAAWAGCSSSAGSSSSYGGVPAAGLRPGSSHGGSVSSGYSGRPGPRHPRDDGTVTVSALSCVKDAAGALAKVVSRHGSCLLLSLSRSGDAAAQATHIAAKSLAVARFYVNAHMAAAGAAGIDAAAVLTGLEPSTPAAAAAAAAEEVVFLPFQRASRGAAGGAGGGEPTLGFVVAKAAAGELPVALPPPVGVPACMAGRAAAAAPAAAPAPPSSAAAAAAPPGGRSQVLKCGAHTDVNRLSNAVVHNVLDGSHAALQLAGAAACQVAMRALVKARSRLLRKFGADVVVTASFANEDTSGSIGRSTVFLRLDVMRSGLMQQLQAAGGPVAAALAAA